MLNNTNSKNVPSIALNDQQINMNHIDSSDIMSTTTTFSSSSSSGGPGGATCSSSTTAATTTTTTAATRKEEIFSASNIFDLIHGVQINCECSPLDKENSHFVIADLAIAAIELIKTSQQQQQRQAMIDDNNLLSSKPKYTPSPSIRIRSNQREKNTTTTIIEATESFLDLTLENSSSVSPLPSAGFESTARHRRKSLSMVAAIPIPVDKSSTRPTTRRSRSLNDLASVSKSQLQTPSTSIGGPNVAPTSKASASFMLFENSVDSRSLSTADMSSSFSTSPPPPPASHSSSSFLLRNPTDSRLLKFSSPPNNRLPDQSSRLTPPLFN